MQIVGLALLSFVVWYGFGEREHATISAFDFHAFIMVVGGSTSAIMVSSNVQNTLRTLLCLREIVPAAGTLAPETESLESEREQLVQLWRDGQRARAVEIADRSEHPAIRRMLALVLDRSPDEAIHAAFTELEHEAMLRWQPAVANWELLSKLAPSFGMVGTITGMIQMFRTLGEDTNMGAAISLALLATLYGVAFGAGIAGPIGHFLRGLLDERLGALERCQMSTRELVARAGRSAAGA